LPRTVVRSCENSAICWNIRASDSTRFRSRENLIGADNQQGRSVRIPSETTCRTPCTNMDDDIVRASQRCEEARRNDESAGCKTQSVVTKLSEIPCRVSNIARGDGNIVRITGSNRWSPTGASCGCVAGNTEGKIRRKNRIPVTTRGMRSSDGIN
jgi:hypothetical protein